MNHLLGHHYFIQISQHQFIDKVKFCFCAQIKKRSDILQYMFFQLSFEILSYYPPSH